MRIAYCLKTFPVLSQTFISREIAALREHGLPSTVFRQERGALTMVDESVDRVLPIVRDVLPTDPRALRRYGLHFLVYRPFRAAHIRAHIAHTDYGPSKSFRADTATFWRVVYLAGMLRDEGITHIHAPWADSASYEAMLAARLAGITYSVQARAGYDIYNTHFNHALVEKLSGARFIITNSEYNRAYLTMLLGQSAPPIHIIFNGVDTRRLTPQPALPGDIPRILFVGRLVESKGIEYLLQACRILRERGVTFRCDIFGESGENPHRVRYYERLMALYHSLDLSAVVRFRGVIAPADVGGEMHTSTVVVLPSVIAQDGGRDMTPNVLLEAMALAIPVVSTTTTAIPEIVTHNVEGLLVPPRDALALADVLERIIREPALCARLGVAGRKRVEAQFDLNKNTRARKVLFDALAT